MRNWISVEKFNLFLFKYGPHSKKFVEQMVQKCPARPWELHFPCAGNFLKTKQFFWATWFFSSFCGLERKRVQHLTNFFLHCWQEIWVLRLRSTAPTWCFFWTLFSFFTNFDLWELNFHTQSKNVRRSYRKCTLGAQMTIWWTVGSPLKSVTVFPTIWVLKRTLCRIFVQKSSGTSIETLFVHAQKAILEGNTVYDQNNICQINFGIRAENILTLTTNSCTVVKTAFYVSRTPSSYLFERFFFF